MSCFHFLPFSSLIMIVSCLVLMYRYTSLFQDGSLSYSDLTIGFEETLYSVAESAGALEISARPFADKNGNVPRIGIPLGVRVKSRDGTAVGKQLWCKFSIHVYTHYKVFTVYQYMALMHYSS